MSLISLASWKSLWRGYEYYKGNRVNGKKIKSETEFEAKVSGSGSTYTVNIDTEHPRKSKCNCPHAYGRRVICKHMIALYFSVFPDEAEDYYKEVVSYEEEQERMQEEVEIKIERYINKLSKNELKDLIYQLLYEGPEWQFDRFVNENIEW